MVNLSDLSAVMKIRYIPSKKRKRDIAKEFNTKGQRTITSAPKHRRKDARRI